MPLFSNFEQDTLIIEKSSTISEQDLILLLRKKDTRGIEYLYDHYSATLYGVILKIVRSEELAQEVLQDAFLKIWDKIDMYHESKGRLFTWMINISRNLALDKLRSKDFKKGTKTDTFNSNVSLMEADRIQPESIGVKEILNTLSQEQKQIIDLMYFQGYTQSEIAEEFGIPLGTIKTRVKSAINKLRTLF